VELVVPPFERRPWPTLGPQVCQFIEEGLVFGPGDLRGKPASLDDEQRALIYRMYEVWPKGTPRESKRRFRRVAISLRKGLRKTELAAWITATELHPEAPVRCDGFRRRGSAWEPVGRPVVDPYIPMFAYTEDQTEELGYGALYAILTTSTCPLVNDFDVGLDRTVRADGTGKCVPMASAPDAADGARTTFQHKDETHRWVLPHHREVDKITRANLLKRPLADPWELETTIMYAPGENSVAEATHDYARRVASGEVTDSRLFFFHRQASPKINTSKPEGLLRAIREASGIAASWSDIDGIASMWNEAGADIPYLKRAWLNLPERSAEKAFDAARWKQLTVARVPGCEHKLVTLGFDGSKTRDSTAVVATCVACGYQWPVGIWYPELATGEVDAAKVEVALDEVFREREVWRLYADPPYWETYVAAWATRWGPDRVVEWYTYRPRAMGAACRAFANAITAGDVWHNGDAQLAEHIGNCHAQKTNALDDQGVRLWTIQKERSDSVHKIDGAAAAILSWEARLDAIAAGAEATPPSVYETRGVTVIGAPP
jgi:hypothetical protein